MSSICISQLYILAARGDKIISKTYRKDIAPNSDEIFYHQLRTWEPEAEVIGARSGSADAPPVFNIDGINFAWLKRNQMYFVVTSRRNDCGSGLLEFLSRLSKLIKDYTGFLSEESTRKNFVLVYEILDEVIDNGYIQEISTEKLRQFIFGECSESESPKEAERSKGSLAGRLMKEKSTEAISANVSVAAGGKRNQVFVDILERLTVVWSPNGKPIKCEVEGSINMRNFLAGTPLVRLALNDDLVFGDDPAAASYASVALKTCNFHECVAYENFEQDRALTFSPPQGEFAVMNYRSLSGEHTTNKLPFRVTPIVDIITPFQVEITIRVRSIVPTKTVSNNVVCTIPLPSNCNLAKPELGVGAREQTAEHKPAERQVVWKISKFKGETENVIRVRLSLASPASPDMKREIGHIGLAFETQSYNVSGLKVADLKIDTKAAKSNEGVRWVRSITQSNSYVTKLT